MTEDHGIEPVTGEIGKKTMKVEVQNEVKKIRNKEEKTNGKIKKNKQQLTAVSSMKKYKEKLYDDRTTINKKQQIVSRTRGYDA